MKMPTKGQAAEQIKELPYKAAHWGQRRNTQLTTGPILTQHVGSMRLPEGKNVFWLKQKIGTITFQSSDTTSWWTQSDPRVGWHRQTPACTPRDLGESEGP